MWPFSILLLLRYRELFRNLINVISKRMKIDQVLSRWMSRRLSTFCVMSFSISDRRDLSFICFLFLDLSFEICRLSNLWPGSLIGSSRQSWRSPASYPHVYQLSTFSVLRSSLSKLRGRRWTSWPGFFCVHGKKYRYISACHGTEQFKLCQQFQLHIFWIVLIRIESYLYRFTLSRNNFEKYIDVSTGWISTLKSLNNSSAISVWPHFQKHA